MGRFVYKDDSSGRVYVTIRAVINGEERQLLLNLGGCYISSISTQGLRLLGPFNLVFPDGVDVDGAH
jgi:hypothetical protein